VLVDVGDTRLHVDERGGGELALVLLHGGPGLDHTMFGDWLDPLGDAHRLLLVSSGIPSERFLGHVEEQLAAFEPVELREQVPSSWARETQARTPADVGAIIDDQLPFHFADPRNPRIEDMRAAGADAVYSPAVLRAAATEATATSRSRTGSPPCRIPRSSSAAATIARARWRASRRSRPASRAPSSWSSSAAGT
jgi:hypothetical protein